MTSLFSRFRGDMVDDLESQVARLHKEVRSLRKSLGRQGSHLLDDGRDMASDVYDELAHRLSDALPVIQRQSKAVQRAASDHPMTTAVLGLALIGVVVGLMATRSASAPPQQGRSGRARR